MVEIMLQFHVTASTSDKENIHMNAMIYSLFYKRQLLPRTLSEKKEEGLH